MRLLVICGLSIAASACGLGSNGTDSNSRIQGLSASSSATNIGVLFGAANGLPGIDKDLRIMQTVLEDKQGQYNFKTIAAMDASPSKILATVKEQAPLVGNDGTFLFYFSGHGGYGGLMAAGGSIQMNSIIKAIREARETPLKRLMVFIDTCNNGSIARSTGSNAINLTETGAYDAEAEAAALADAFMYAAESQNENYAGQLYEELFVMTSSTETESSNAGSQGSTFTVAVLKAFQQLKENPSATLGQFAESTKRITVQGGHTPVYRAVPETLLSKPLVNSDDPNGGGGVVTPVVPGTLAMTANLYLKLGEEASNGGSMLYTAAPAGAASMAVCFGDAATCKASGKKDMTFKSASGSDAGLRYFVSDTSLRINDGLVVTLLSFDQAGTMTGARALKFGAR